MAIEPWEIPILAMAVIAGPTSVFWAVRWFRSRSSALDADPANSGQEPNGKHARSDSVRNRTALERRRALIFAALTTVLLVIFVIILGEEAANTLIAAATAVTALVSAVLAVHSAFLLQELQKERQKLQSEAEAEAGAGAGVVRGMPRPDTR